MSQIVVLFEVTPTPAGKDRYLALAGQLKPLLAGFEGFVSAERFISLNEEGKLLSMNVWENEEALSRWRNVVAHRMSQAEGRERLFADYKITVCSVVRSYGMQDRAQAPQDSRGYFEQRENKES